MTGNSIAPADETLGISRLAAETRKHLGPIGAIAALDAAAARAVSDAARVEAVYRIAELWRELGEIERAYGLMRELCLYRDDIRYDQFSVVLGLYRESADEAFLAGLRAWFFARVRDRQDFVPLRPRLGPARARLRVGFLGLDLVIPCYAALLVPLLRNLDPARVEAIAFVPDAPEQLLDRLRSVGIKAVALPLPLAEYHLPEHQAGGARRLAEFDLDVLIDLGDCLGPTAEMLLHRPAPIQATWQNMLGPCPDPAIDLLIGNGAIYPPGLRAHYGRKAALLPADLFVYDPGCFGTPPPPPAPPPCLKNGYVTFGSLSHLYKMGDASLALWAKVLRAVPGSRLRLGNGALADASVRDRVASRLVHHGADRARIEIGTVEGWPDYLAAYDGIDVALATVPVAGGTTMFEALYQGIPVLSRVYPTPLGRLGRWLEAATGQSGIAHDSDESLVAAAVALAADPAALAGPRATARDRLAAKSAQDAPRLARAFEAILAEYVARRRGD
jgi:protein O-GlcNAc transferase